MRIMVNQHTDINKLKLILKSQRWIFLMRGELPPSVRFAKIRVTPIIELNLQITMMQCYNYRLIQSKSCQKEPVTSVRVPTYIFITLIELQEMLSEIIQNLRASKTFARAMMPTNLVVSLLNLMPKMASMTKSNPEQTK